MATRSCCSTPRTAVAGARSATSAPAPCRSTKRSSASATIHTSWNCAKLTIEPRQRIDTQSEDRSLETTDTKMSSIVQLTDADLDMVSGGRQGNQSNSSTITIGDVSNSDISITVNQTNVNGDDGGGGGGGG